MNAGDGRERRADHEGQEMVRSTSTPSSAAMVWSCSQARMSRPSRVRDNQPCEDRQQHNGRDHDDDLHVGQPDHEAALFIRV